MVARYQPPPTWPAPPPGWTPPPGWQPDPAWGPAPAGWQFWVDDGQPAAPHRPNRHAFRWSILSALAWWLVLVVVLSVGTGGFNPDAAGALLASFVLGGVVAALTVRWASARVPLWVYPLLVLPFVFVLRVLSVAGGGV